MDPILLSATQTRSLSILECDDVGMSHAPIFKNLPHVLEVVRASGKKPHRVRVSFATVSIMHQVHVDNTRPDHMPEKDLIGLAVF